MILYQPPACRNAVSTPLVRGRIAVELRLEGLDEESARLRRFVAAYRWLLAGGVSPLEVEIVVDSSDDASYLAEVLSHTHDPAPASLRVSAEPSIGTIRTELRTKHEMAS